MKLRNQYSVILALLLFLTLGACGKPKSDPIPSANAASKSENAANSNTNSPVDDAAPLRLALPEGICAQVTAKIPASVLPLQLAILDTPTAAKDLLLNSCSSDLILLSPQSAAELYRSGTPVQLVALVSSPTPDDFGSLECLVAEASFLANHRDLISRFLTAYQSVVSSKQVENAFLATGWDMVDLVQQDLEAQYQQHPDSDHSIPDGNFYFFPP